MQYSVTALYRAIAMSLIISSPSLPMLWGAEEILLYFFDFVNMYLEIKKDLRNLAHLEKKKLYK